MFAHIQIGARDLPRMCEFYDRVLVHFGLERVVQLEAVGPAGWFGACRGGAGHSSSSVRPSTAPTPARATARR